jgi:putative endonuclease
MHYVYLLKSLKHDWVYVGSTSDLIKRLKEHNKGEVRSTKNRIPYKLAYYEAYENIQYARDREKEIKRNRSKKEDILKRFS